MNNTCNRSTLLRFVNLVKPALAVQDYIPAFKHIDFDDQIVTAYNDISAISVVTPSTGLKCCIPGELLSKALTSLPGDNILLQINDDKNLLLTSGRSKLKLPTMNRNDYPFDMPNVEGPSVVLNAMILKGIDICMISVGTNPKHPAQMGITLDQENGQAVLYSTDNFSISRFETLSDITLPGDAPIILPTFFCQQLIALNKALPDAGMRMTLIAGALLVDFEIKNVIAATLFTKTLVDLEPLDFQKIMTKHGIREMIKSNALMPIPDAFDSAFQRTLLVLDNEYVKTAHVTLQKNVLKIHAKSAMGDSEDTMPFESTDNNENRFSIDPELVLRASKLCSHMLLLPHVLLLATEDMTFLHLISHVA